MNSRLRRRQDYDKKVMGIMILLYCRRRHKGGSLCKECSELQQYAFCKIERCPLGVHKRSCQGCKIHCYKPAMRSKIKQVMRFSGPRLLLLHPLTAICHLLK